MTSVDEALASPARFELDPQGWPQVTLPKILAVALRHFAERGYHATSVRHIARDAGCTVPALYYHYGNKQGILTELLGITMAALTGCVTAAEDPRLSPPEQLAALVEALCRFIIRFPDLAFLDSDRRALTPENLTAYLARRDVVEAKIRGAIAAGVAAGCFHTAYPVEAARAIIAACLAMGGWFHADGPVGADEMTHRYAQLALATVDYRA